MLNNDSSIDLPSRQAAHGSYQESLQKFYADIEWRKIHALFDHQDFKPSLKWISEMIGCSVEKCNEVIEGLIILGVVKRSSEGFTIANLDFSFNDHPGFIRETRIDASIQLAHQIANERDYTRTGLDRTTFLSTNRELVLEFYDEVSKVVEAFRTKSLEAKKKDVVFSMALIGSDVLKEKQV